jgi:hypothetical protein
MKKVKASFVSAVKKIEEAECEYEHLVSVRLQLELDEAVIYLLHPDNTSYPIGKWALQETIIKFH